MVDGQTHGGNGIAPSVASPTMAVWRKGAGKARLATARQTHTPSTAFRHPPPNSARFSYATEGALFVSAQLSSDAVRFGY